MRFVTKDIIARLNQAAKSDMRDDFAKTAMLGMLTFGETKNRNPTHIAETSYAIADAMIKERNKNESN